MTTTFSFSRLLQLIKKQWVENARLYIFSVLALLGLLGLVFIFWITSSGNQFREDATYFIFIIGLFISGAVFASMSFNMFGDKAKATYWLGFPASHLEKLICMIFYSLIVFSLVYVACFFIVQSLAIAWVRQAVARDPLTYSFLELDWTNPRGFRQVFKICMFGFIGVQSFYFLGSAYFSRYSFVLTTVFGAAIFLAFFLFIIYLAKDAFPHGFSWNGDYVRDFEKGRDYQLSSFTKETLLFLAKYIWAPVFWLVAWFRLKEKQV